MKVLTNLKINNFEKKKLEVCKKFLMKNAHNIK